MPEDRNILAVFRANKPLFIIIIVGLFLVELEIFAVAALKSGKKSWIQVFDSKGSLIHEADGRNLSQFNKYYFEKTFGPIENYDMKLKTRTDPFPFRAWFAAAVGIPVGMILLFGFILKAYVALFFPEKARAPDPLAEKTQHYESKLEGVVDKVSRMNVFIIGLIVFLTVVGLWFLPNTFQYLGKTSIRTIEEHKWFFIGGMGVLLAVVLWLIYLRYLLAKKTIESQMELNKYQLKLQYEPKRQALLEGSNSSASDPALIELDQHRKNDGDVKVKNHI